MSELSKVILASASEARRRILASAGIPVRIQVSTVDETILKAQYLKENPSDVGGLALFLATAKAENVSAVNPGALVIGADQTLVIEGTALDKPSSLEEARLQLIRLRSKSHHLCSGVSVARNGRAFWSLADKAELRMRNFTDQFMSSYLKDVGEDALTSVGAYKIESRGVQLFDGIRGDYFTILGLPLLPLMSFLRSEGCLPT